jgi:hypothetical protein
MPLLTPSETLVLEGFLNNVSSYSDVYSPEWAMITEHLVEDDSHLRQQQKEQLARATKDLMSLDYANRVWPDPDPRASRNSAPTFGSFVSPQTLTSHYEPLFTHSSRNSFPSFGSAQPSSYDPYIAHTHSLGPPTVLASPSQHAQPPHGMPRTRSDVLPIAHSRQRAATVDGLGGSKRSITESTLLPSPKRRRPSISTTPSAIASSSIAALHPPSALARSASSASTASSRLPTPTSAGPTSAPSGGGSVSKPTLLSPSQKKANHIQSEQKRRANIRRGYEALCEVVPALREAIAVQEAEEAAAQRAAEGKRGTTATRKKRPRTKAGEDGEKLDGRAGPRSEYVVLQKCECVWQSPIVFFCFRLGY